MMLEPDIAQPLNLRFSPQVLQDLLNLSHSLNTTPGEIVGQALALFKVAQGRLIILKDQDKGQTVEIKNYIHTPVQTKFEVK